MKNVLKQLLIALLLVTMILPLLPLSAASSSLTQTDMRLMTGGKQSVDCGALASAAEALCYLGGGSSTTCLYLYGIAYVGCLVAKIL